MVIVYSSPQCVQCSATYRALEKAGVAFEKVDVTESPKGHAIVTALGYRQLPVVFVDESTHWSGYDPNKIATLS